MVFDLLRNAAQKYPQHTAIIEAGREIPYDDLLDRCTQLARYLVRHAKVARGDRIALFMPNSLEFVMSLFAVLRAGGVLVPVNTRLRAPELRQYVQRMDLRGVITSATSKDLWYDVFDQDPSRITCVAESFDDIVSYTSDSSGVIGRDADHRRIGADQDAILLTTSGSTGVPQIVPRSHHNVASGVENVSRALRVEPTDRFLGVVPFYHANGLANGLLLPLSCGASIVVMPVFTPRAAFDAIERENITVQIGSPFIFGSMGEYDDRKDALRTVRLCISSGGRMPAEITQRFRDRFGIRIRQLYGSSEAGTIAIQYDEDLTDSRSVGRPLESVHVRVLGHDDADVTLGEAGEIVVKSAAMMSGYLDTEGNDELFHDGFYRTRDLGYVSAEGEIILTGRKTRLINVGGVKVDPVEIQNVLESHPQVTQAFVMGVQHRHGVELIKATIVAHDRVTVEEIIGYCRTRLAEFKVPRVVEFHSELPAYSMNKEPQTQEESSHGFSSTQTTTTETH